MNYSNEEESITIKKNGNNINNNGIRTESYVVYNRMNENENKLHINHY